MPAIAHDPTGHRFSILQGGETARLDYELRGSTISITHTYVPVAARGRGVAAQLMQAALSYAQEHSFTVIPVCSYAVRYMQQLASTQSLEHQESLLDEALDESFPASDPPATGHVD